MSRFRCPGCQRLVRGNVKQLCETCQRDRKQIIDERLQASVACAAMSVGCGSMLVMDPVSLIVGALASGAASGLKKTVGTAIADGYKYLKGLISDRYGLSTDALDKKPESPVQRAALRESLADAGAGGDSELLRAAQALLVAIEADDPAAAETVGVELSRINAGEIDIEAIKASGGATGVKASDITADSMKIKDVDARGQGADRP